jgi:hypothetical protein
VRRHGRHRENDRDAQRPTSTSPERERGNPARPVPRAAAGSAELLRLQRLAGNRAVSTLVAARPAETVRPAAVQRHSAAALAEQLEDAKAEEDEEEEETATVQRHSGAALAEQLEDAKEEEEGEEAGSTVQRRVQRLTLQRHVLQKPNVETNHRAAIGTRDVAAFRKIAADTTFQKKIKTELQQFAASIMTGTALKAKNAEIAQMRWVVRDNLDAVNPAQVKGAGPIDLFAYFPDWYNPDGSLREDFAKSTMLHESLHYVSYNHAGFQESLAFLATGEQNDSLDEAVTERISYELAQKVLGPSQVYTTSYWNMLGRRGTDFHLTSKGLEDLATGESKLWLGALTDVFLSETTKSAAPTTGSAPVTGGPATTPMSWDVLKRAYLTGDGKAEVLAQLEAHRSEIDQAWKAKRDEALKTQLGNDAIAAANWEQVLKAATTAVDGAAAPGTAMTKDQIKSAVDARLQTDTGAEHQVVITLDVRSSSVNDWRVVRENTRNIVSPPGTTKVGVWNETTAQTSGGTPGALFRAPQPPAVTPRVPFFTPGGSNTVATRLKKRATSAASAELGRYITEADGLLGNICARHPMGWLIIPTGTPLLSGDKFDNYPGYARTHLPAALLSKSLTALMGKNAKLPAEEVVNSFGGAGYETNGDLGVINEANLSFETVLHEMGHHRQKYDKGLSEENVGQITKLFPILDLHNILYSDNKAAEAECRRNPSADPVLRLRYTEHPVKLKRSEWLAFANNVVESQDYKRFEERLTRKGGPAKKILDEIDAELANATLYPGAIPALFKNLMVKEIFKSSKVVEPTDVRN